MIWEVDEDCDQALTWPEFQAMYQRCRNDQTGAHCVSALPRFIKEMRTPSMH